ncbi:hypothetical protein NLX83_03895 [Allokutzneria sp. A3M-2-11 16]|uniref:hypothetical protein n=1 Tax=Allokutzneria sp. A3M-2-11 16 TaxID=2962043 RepID=UPI0020B690BF|nr:hypothetical protein [Allokutzneria sp. A3M-2-11 16]MCP3798395.1 hypothetical protein [Allokutzneria sp. A3M-2-11 16]
MRITLARAGAAVLAASAIALAGAGGQAAASAENVLGPDGFGPLKVGMSLADAIATGKVGEPVGGNDLCRGYKWAYSSGPVLTISKAHGIYSIPGTAKGAHTPEGIGSGSTADAVKKAYPKAVDGWQNGTAIITTVTPQNPANRYLFGIKEGKVTGFALQAVNARDCAAG